ncbi:hypothetical protein [Microbulbifer sp. ARAS458-1]|uniref:hypothetical protein n=1 Tax=Microbulbifer sp. ARAS458-1 TaxID=3140242 RepID=UPI003877C044
MNQLPHRWAADISAGRRVIADVPAELRELTEYQLGLLIGTRRAHQLDVRLGLAGQGTRMTDFEQLSDATKRGVRLGLQREFFLRRHQARRGLSGKQRRGRRA